MNKLKWIIPTIFLLLSIIILGIKLRHIGSNEEVKFIYPQSSQSMVYYLETSKFSFVKDNENLTIRNFNNQSIQIPNYKNLTSDWLFSESSELLAPKPECELVGIQINLLESSGDFTDNVEKLFCTQYNFEKIQTIQ